MRLRLLIGAFILFSTCMFAQKDYKNKSYVVNSYLKAIRESKDLNVDVYIKELITKEDYLNQKYGIFVVSSLITSTTKYILLIDNGKPRFIKSRDYLSNLKMVVSYFIKNPIYSDNDIKLYLDELYKVFDYNKVIYESHGEIRLD